MTSNIVCPHWRARPTALTVLLDVVAAFPNATRQYWFDATVRSPHAARYNETVRHNATDVPGYAVHKGCQEKWNKYGNDVIPVAFEPYGRIADESVKSLEEIAINAAILSDDRWTSPNLLSSRIRRIQRLVIWAAADVDLTALGKGGTKMEASIARGAMMRTIQSGAREPNERTRNAVAVTG